MSKIRLLIVSDDAYMGGSYRVAEQLVAGMNKSFDVQFACPFNDKNAESRAALATAGIAIHDYQASGRNGRRSTFATVDAEDLLDAASPDLLLTVDAGEIYSLLALKH